LSARQLSTKAKKRWHSSAAKQESERVVGRHVV
jgi:hypothetical protein